MIQIPEHTGHAKLGPVSDMSIKASMILMFCVSASITLQRFRNVGITIAKLVFWAAFVPADLHGDVHII
jgi:hypothetical protein